MAIAAVTEFSLALSVSEIFVSLENMSFENVLASVGKDYVDVAAAGISVTDERKGMVDFSTSYYESSQVLVVLDSDKTFDECRTEKEIIEKLEKLK